MHVAAWASHRSPAGHTHTHTRMRPLDWLMFHKRVPEARGDGQGTPTSTTRPERERPFPPPFPHHPQVVAYDYGIKKNILRRLASFGCRITVVPASWPASEVLKMNPDGVFFSNGPVSVGVWEPAVLHARLLKTGRKSCSVCVRERECA